MAQVTPERPVAKPGRASDDTAFFGHPRGLGFIVTAEVGWSFAYYGMVSILTLYMTQRLFTPGHMEHIWGFAAYSRVLQTLFGAMTPLALASQTFGLVTGLIYATPILGGLLGDRWIGQGRAVMIGLGVLVAGHLALIAEQSFLIAIALLIVGGGLVKSNLLGQIGRLYGPDDPRRARAFGIFLIGVNIGGFITPLVVGTLGEKVGWSQGFMAAAGGMLLAFVAYLAGRRHMPTDEVSAPKVPALGGGCGLNRRELAVILALLAVLVTEVLNIGSYNQAFNLFPVWASQHVNRTLFGFQMPVTWFSALDGVLTIVATLLAVGFWGWQSSRGREPRETTRIAIGCAMTTAGFLVLAVASALSGAGKVPLVAPIAFFVLVDGALPWVDTVMMALISRAAPARLTTTLLGVYYLSFAVGNFLVGWLGRTYETLAPAHFWGLHAAIAGSAVVFLMVMGSRLNRVLDSDARVLGGIQ